MTFDSPLQEEIEAYTETMLERDGVYARDVTNALFKTALKYAYKEFRWYVFGEAF